jgi:hypothetical protein
MGKRGPKSTEYDAKKHAVIAAALAAQGLLDEQIYTLLGITKAMFYRWKKRYPEFAEALKDAKAPVDDSVEKSLYERAMGFDSEETEIIGVPDGSGGIMPREVRKKKKHVPPDTTACIFWLKNRRREQWRDVQEREHSGDLKVSVGSFADLAKLVTDDEATAAKV